MVKEDLLPARAALHEAAQAVRNLEELGTEPATMQAAAAIINAWSRLLVFGNRVFTKLEQVSKNSSTGRAWYSRVKKRRSEDPLLRYLQHARNTDEHSLTRVTVSDGGSFHVTVPSNLPPDATILHLDPTGGGNHKPGHPRSESCALRRRGSSYSRSLIAELCMLCLIPMTDAL
jgi:hypothetical protein